MLFVIKDRNDRPVGRVEDGGEVKDMNGRHLGQWDSDGDLFNSSGNKVTRLDRCAAKAGEAYFLLGGN
jgi:hypothetical protein